MMADFTNGINYTITSRYSKLKGVYVLLEKLKVPETPPWKNESKFPPTSKMLQSIVDNKNNYEQSSQKKLHFLLNSNRGEGEGTQESDSTENAINKKDGDDISFEEQVTKNLLAAVNHLEIRNSGEDRGLLDIEECIQDTHKILMKNLLRPNKCGEFSTERRETGDGHVYPKFDTKDEAYDAVERVVDGYNSTINYLKNSDLDPYKQHSMYIRCAAWILYKFVNLHPFSDGNGRMCRLLASRCLNLIFPFPCPIYNIYAPTTRDDYINAIKEAHRHNGEKLGDLVALLIESGWHTAKYLYGPD